MVMSNIPSALVVAQSNAGLLPRCEHALELLHTHRGNPSDEVDRVLADDPQCVFGHCLRAALIVLADNPAARFRARREPAPPSMRRDRSWMSVRAVTRTRRVRG